ncbi:MAG: hypothetical protein AAF639_12610 [Chloroflexota bacterium]
MLAVKEQTQFTTQDAFSLVTKLPSHEFANFAKRIVVHYQHQNGQLFIDDEEQDLLDIIYNTRLTPEQRKRSDFINAKNKVEDLTEEEEEERKRFIEVVSQNDITRFKAIMNLAEKRNTSINQLMSDLGLGTHHR